MCWAKVKSTTVVAEGCPMRAHEVQERAPVVFALQLVIDDGLTLVALIYCVYYCYSNDGYVFRSCAVQLPTTTTKLIL